MQSFTITNTTPQPNASPDRAVLVITNKMIEDASAPIPANIVVTQVELLPGVPCPFELGPGQFQTVTQFQG